MFRNFNHFGFGLALVVAALYAACAPRPTAPASSAVPVAIVTTGPTLTHLPIKSPPVVVTLTAIPPSPSPTASQIQHWTGESPDGRWTVVGYMEGPFEGGEGQQYHTNLKVEGDSVEWIAWDATANYGLGYTTPRPLHWSDDGNFLYFTNEPVVDGCAVFVNGSDLWRLDLRSGETANLVSSVGLWLSLSPDETQLAYIAYGDRGLVIRDLESGLERGLKLDLTPQAQAGELVWSPDGKALTYTVEAEPCTGKSVVSTVEVEVESLR